MDAAMLTAHQEDTCEALQSFLTQLLGQDDVVLDVEAPAEAKVEGIQDDLASGLIVSTSSFAVVLDSGTVPLVSEALLGQTMGVDDPGVEDLVSEVTAQGYGAVRTQLASAGVELPESTFEVSLPDQERPTLPDTLWRVAFTLSTDDQTLTGVAFFKRTPATASDPQGSTSAAPGSAASDAPSASRETAAESAPASDPVEVAPADFSDLGAENIRGQNGVSGNFDMLAEVELDVRVELGRRQLPLADVLQLTSGSVIELEKLVGEPLNIYANGRFIAEGEAVVIDEKFGVRITKLAPARQQSNALL